MSVSPVCTPSPGVGTHGYITIVDVQGYPIGTVATSDGADFGSISGESQFFYNNGGPVDVNGFPTGNSFDRARGYLGKNSVNKTISSTNVGDTTIVFSSAPKTVMRGHAIRLTGGAVNEYVYIDPTFTPTVSTVTFPLKSPVVNAGQTTAIYDQFDPTGPAGGSFNPVGVGLTALALVSPSNTGMYAMQNANADPASTTNFPEVVIGGLINAVAAERLRVPHVFKPFNATAVPTTGGASPISIWTPAAGTKFRLMGYWFSTTVAAGLVFHDLASAGSGGLMPIPSPIHPAAGVIASPSHLENGIVSSSINNQLFIDATTATTLTGFVYGTEE